MVGSGVGARRGILFKSAAALENTGKAVRVIFDKTGTLTAGTPAVVSIYTADGVREDELLSAAVSLEAGSSHPLARAVVAMGEEKGVPLSFTEAFTEVPGRGVKATIGGEELRGGNRAFLPKAVSLSPGDLSAAEAMAERGETPLFFAKSTGLLGILGVSDPLRPTAGDTISALTGMGLSVSLLTGDNPRTANAVARAAGIPDENVRAGVLPDGKEAALRELLKSGPAAFVGDGINDAPALTRATVGIAIGAGSDIAIDAADVVLMHSDPADVADAITLSQKVIRNIRQNLFWAFFYNVICIPLAAGALYPFGILLNPMIAAGAMSLSSLFVVGNALRLNRALPANK